MTVSGTPMYMSPEQAIGDRSLDARADIYAMGAMMYFALTGRPPFTGETAVRHHDGAGPRPGRPPLAGPARRARRPRAGRPPLPGQGSRRALPNVRALGDALAACASAAEWGPNRAEAWWTAEGISVTSDGPPDPLTIMR